MQRGLETLSIVAMGIVAGAVITISIFVRSYPDDELLVGAYAPFATKARVSLLVLTTISWLAAAMPLLRPRSAGAGLDDAAYSATGDQGVILDDELDSLTSGGGGVAPTLRSVEALAATASRRRRNEHGLAGALSTKLLRLAAEGS
jgi:hypothetical protein